jgi:hypothetical protein
MTEESGPAVYRRVTVFTSTFWRGNVWPGCIEFFPTTIVSGAVKLRPLFFIDGKNSRSEFATAIVDPCGGSGFLDSGIS